MAPPRNSGSKPGRSLAVLVALIVVMLIGIVGANAFSPGKWHKDFKIGLGLDLSSGTQATLQAVTQKGKTPPDSDMEQAVAIITSRVNSSGSTGVSVQRQGSSDITVTVPGAGSQQVINEVSTTAQLRFRPVLLEGSSTPATSATPTPSPSATGTEGDQHEGVTEPEREHQGVHPPRRGHACPRGQGQRQRAAEGQRVRDAEPGREQFVRGQHRR